MMETTLEKEELTEKEVSSSEQLVRIDLFNHFHARYIQILVPRHKMNDKKTITEALYKGYMESLTRRD